MGRGKVRRPPPSDAQAELGRLYASLPAIECRGECWDSCGSITMTRLEQQRIVDRHGLRLPLVAAFAADGDGRCPALTMLGRCSVHSDRPLICRLWGLVPSMRCNFGCVPEGGLMAERDGFLTIARAAELSGDHRLAAGIRDLWEDPERAIETEKRLRADQREREARWDARRNITERRGTAIYMTAAGRLTATPTPQSRATRT